MERQILDTSSNPVWTVRSFKCVAPCGKHVKRMQIHDMLIRTEAVGVMKNQSGNDDTNRLSCTILLEVTPSCRCLQMWLAMTAMEAFAQRSGREGSHILSDILLLTTFALTGHRPQHQLKSL
jgi:hypothetical protein